MLQVSRVHLPRLAVPVAVIVMFILVLVFGSSPSHAANSSASKASAAASKQDTAPASAYMPPLCFKHTAGQAYDEYDLAQIAAKGKVYFYLKSGVAGHEVWTPAFPHWVRIDLGKYAEQNKITVASPNNVYVKDFDLFTTLNATNTAQDYNESAYILEVPAIKAALHVVLNARVPRC